MKLIFFFLMLELLLLSETNVTLYMHGDLDDDLFVLRADNTQTFMIDCFQMHNPTQRFLYEGVYYPSRPIYGLIDFEKRYTLQNDQILLVMTANEREEIDSRHMLLQRTHYKSVPLFANDLPLLPSTMPEKDDIPDYPLWFGSDEKPLLPSMQGYNYYRLWENALVNIGVIFPKEGSYKLHLIDATDKVQFSQSFHVKKEVTNLHILGNHPLTEVDGKIYSDKTDSIRDNIIKQKAITSMIIESRTQRFYVNLPYPLVYLNRIYVKGL
jgi:hypothetical protein